MPGLFPRTDAPRDQATTYIPNPATVPFWDDPPNSIEPGFSLFSPWDICFINQQGLPGLARVEGKCHREFDIKKPRGSDSATITSVGQYPGKFDISLRIWTSQQLDNLQSIIPTLKPKRGVKPTAVDVMHPALTLLGIRSLIIVEVGTLNQTGIPGVREMKINCLEFWPGLIKDVTTTVQHSTAKYNTPTVLLQQSQDTTPQPPSVTDVGP
jgi:hypothetical protein